MPKNNESVNRELYDLLDTRGYNPVSRDSDVSQAGKTVPPEEADVFRFTFKQDGKDIDDAWATIDKARTLIVYYDKDIADKAGEKSASAPYDDSWYGLLKFFKKWAHSRQLSFSLEPKEKLDSDMAQRTYMKKKEQIAEGYYPMGKAASYNDNIPTVKIILQHTRQIQEGEQRYRNIAKIFLENTEGERILAPTIKPGIAQVYARHLAEGGVPNDERWNHIKSLCEEYTKMAGFVRAVRGNQFNESAQRLVEAGLNHYTDLRETLGKMRGHRGYTAYFESWTPTLMENEGDDNTLNELFVQETLDPRIESVMPILNKLSKNLGEMKQVKELEEWSESIIENTDIEEGMGTKILAGAALIASLLGINQYQANEVYKNSPQLQALIRLHKEAKESGDISKVKELENRIRLQKDRLDLDKGEVVGKDGMPIQVKEAPGAMSLKHNQSTEKKNLDAFGLDEDAMEESGLQAYLGNKKYGKAGMDALRKAGRDGASKETMASIRAKYDKLDEQGVAEASLASRYADDPTHPSFRSNSSAKKDPADSLQGILALRKTDPFRAFRALQDYGFRNPNDPIIDGASNAGSAVEKEMLQKMGITDPRPWDVPEEVIQAMHDAMFNYIEKNLPKQQGVAEGIGDELDSDPKKHQAHIEDVHKKIQAAGWKEASESELPVAYANMKRARGWFNIPHGTFVYWFKKENPSNPKDPYAILWIPKYNTIYVHTEGKTGRFQTYMPDDLKLVISQGPKQGVAEGTEDMFAVPDSVERLVKQHGLYNEKGYLDLFAKLAGRPLNRAEINPALDNASKLNRLLGNIRMRSEWRGTNPKQDQELIAFANQWMELFNKAKNSFSDNHQQGVAEDLDANQKRVGQLGPTEKVKNNNIGKLVGANESLELNEMDKSQPSSDRGGESSGNPYAKGGKATPVKAKDAEKDAEKALNKSMDKAHKKDVKEGQEDLDAILRIIRK